MEKDICVQGESELSEEDDHESETEEDASLPISDSKKYEQKLCLAKRPGCGNIGNPIALLANYFKIDFKELSVYHYDVEIYEACNFKKPNNAHSREIICKLLNTKQWWQYYPVYDGQKNLFTKHALPLRDFQLDEYMSFDVSVIVERKEQAFRVNIKAVIKGKGTNVVGLEPLKKIYDGSSDEIPQEVLFFLNALVKHSELSAAQVLIKNYFYPFSEKGLTTLKRGLEIWLGFNPTVCLTQKAPMVVINVTARTFYESGPVISYASDVLNCNITTLPTLESSQIDNLSRALKNVCVKVTHLSQPRKYKVKGLSQIPAKDLKFNFGENQNISIVQYFSRQYNITLKYPNLQCLAIQTAINDTFLPMEVCEIVEGQPKTGWLPTDSTFKMKMLKLTSPIEVFDKILSCAHTLHDQRGKIMNAFGLFMDLCLTQVNGRIIPPPELIYSGSYPSCIASPDKRGVWRIEKGKKLFKIPYARKWILLSFAQERSCNMNKLRHFSECLVNSSKKCGMAFGSPITFKIFEGHTTTEDALAYAKNSGAEIAIIVLPSAQHISYGEIKYLADFKYNLVTQCLEEGNLDRMNDQIATNICLKINVKLGGVNHMLLKKPRVFSESTAVFGMHVAHVAHLPPSNSPLSVATIVGVLNSANSKHAFSCRAQTFNKETPPNLRPTTTFNKGIKMSVEIILDVKSMIKDILKTFNCGPRPCRIIFFRHGISNGQMLPALQWEIHGIQEACQEVYRLTLPITYIVVQKNYKAKFRTKDLREGVGEMGNIPVGSVVDSTIVHPVLFDYFLCSHEPKRGISKPTHYIVLYDDNKLTVDALQQLSYFLCHDYAKCTRSVSLPAPVLYAQLASARALKYSRYLSVNDSSDDSYDELPPKLAQAIASMSSFKNSLFYV